MYAYDEQKTNKSIFHFLLDLEGYMKFILPLYFGGRILSYNRLSSGIISPNSSGLSSSFISATAYVISL